MLPTSSLNAFCAEPAADADDIITARGAASHARPPFLLQLLLWVAPPAMQAGDDEFPMNRRYARPSHSGLQEDRSSCKPGFRHQRICCAKGSRSSKGIVPSGLASGYLRSSARSTRPILP